MPKTFAYVLLALTFAGLMAARVALLYAQESSWTLPQYAGLTASVAGSVADDPDVRDTSVRINIKVQSINGASASGVLLAVLPQGVDVAYGDIVVVRGAVALPQAFETQSGRLFDYQNYLRVRGVSTMMPRGVLISDTPAGPSLLGFLFNIKHSFSKSLMRALPEPQASLMEGILLGDRGGLSQVLLQVFVVVGLIHVVVLSGSNISIVAEGVFRLLGFLPRRLAWGAGAAVMVLFVLMVSGGAATLRAAIMVVLAILARVMRRPHAALRALTLASALLLLWNPLLVLDQGFVLSILATFGLITIAPWVERHITAIPAWSNFNLRSIVATTLAVEVFILPALLYYSGVLSIVSVPLNALVLPLIPLVMLAGFTTGVLGFIHPSLALLPALVCDALLRIILIISQWAAALPHAATTLAAFPAWVAVVAYVPLAFVAWRAYRTAGAKSSRA